MQKIEKRKPIEFSLDLVSLLRNVEGLTTRAHDKKAKVLPQSENADYQSWLATTQWAYDGKPFLSKQEPSEQGATGVD